MKDTKTRKNKERLWKSREILTLEVTKNSAAKSSENLVQTIFPQSEF